MKKIGELLGSLLWSFISYPLKSLKNWITGLKKKSDRVKLKEEQADHAKTKAEGLRQKQKKEEPEDYLNWKDYYKR